MTITTIRHGETDWNLQRRPQGSMDIPLNQTGLDQAQALSTKLANTPCDVIYTSSLQRAKTTAEIINTQHKVPLIATDSLREQSFGPFEGQVLETEDDAYDFTMYMDKHIDAHFAKISAFMHELTQASHEDIFVVAHFGTIRCIICHLLGLPIRQRKRYPIGNTAVHRFESQAQGGFAMVLENDTGHLHDPKAPSF